MSPRGETARGLFSSGSTGAVKGGIDLGCSCFSRPAFGEREMSLEPFPSLLPQTRFLHAGQHVYKFKIRYGRFPSAPAPDSVPGAAEELEEVIRVILGNLDDLHPFSTDHFTVFPYLSKWERAWKMRFTHGNVRLTPYPYVCTLYLELNSFPQRGSGGTEETTGREELCGSRSGDAVNEGRCPVQIPKRKSPWLCQHHIPANYNPFLGPALRTEPTGCLGKENFLFKNSEHNSLGGLLMLPFCWNKQQSPHQTFTTPSCDGLKVRRSSETARAAGEGAGQRSRVAAGEEPSCPRSGMNSAGAECVPRLRKAKRGLEMGSYGKFKKSPRRLFGPQFSKCPAEKCPQVMFCPFSLASPASRRGNSYSSNSAHGRVSQGAFLAVRKSREFLQGRGG
ncbi:membrane-anchored junction protein isoform X2 [Cuculus canorus]|uniref:membrane-anchored junction protein isoform X2 n=1 Tax=Cuculus canorus TaxID=55661 RepID=UPI0023AB519C|nr:membrane-anchored junction protein isoform X2 [Cuculus canorus]